MTIEKAIQLLQGYVRPTRFMGHEDIDDAIKLGIEGLKREQARRDPQHYKIGYLLPGETKED